jgi:hypothetical protein
MADDHHDPIPIDVPDEDNLVQIDKDYFKAPSPRMTGRELLQLADKKPAEDFAIYRKIKGGQPERIALDEKVDLSRPGVERFLTLPLDQTEGLGARREFALPEDDLFWLADAPHRFELVAEAGVLRVVLYGFPVPPGYNHRAVDVNVRIESGYPDTQIDMVYVHPELHRLDGVSIVATCLEAFDGKQWQRWSRHRTPANPWRPGVDNLATHFALVKHWLVRELQKG